MLTSKTQVKYADYYQGESRWRRIGARDKAANILGLCEGILHETVLEIGAGEGSVLERLSDLWASSKFHALEVSESGVAAIRSRPIANLVGCQLFDGYVIPYAEAMFDLAVLTHVLEHVEHPRQLVYEAARVARSIFIEVPLEDNAGLPKDFRPNKVGHINHYTAASIRRLVQSCGIKVIRQQVTNPSLPVYEYLYGKMGGRLRYAIKQAGLRLLPAVVTRLWTYHCSLLCGPEPVED